ncbi:hypothetical protein MLD38_034432 [Melastoma candidum]|uniref:Uncharacterized protein n=1 Tax=Melastoma candidum TaxID=119954 RepID=A0ACB9MAE8_9MYRT|nr:hypothetical protein MLD38_034432 [Melastoma candidum]
MATTPLTFPPPLPSHRPSSLRRPVLTLASERPYPSSQELLPLRKIPGNYGLPLIGPLRDRHDYFYNQGRDEYFKSRVLKHRSTVYRTNLPPGPFIAPNPRVVALLDGKSFPVLFDVTKVEKKDLFTGTFMPSTELTGGYRVLSYLDPSEPNHGKLKKLMFFHLQSRRDHVIPEFRSAYSKMFDFLEDEIVSDGKAAFCPANEQAAFNFLARSLYGVNPEELKLGLEGPKLIRKWLLFQIAPLLILGLPKPLEDLAIHTFRLPAFLIKKDYNLLYDFFYYNSGPVLDFAEQLGISREEACHNLLFATCFNSFGGMRILFPNMMKWIGRVGLVVHTCLAREIRSVVRASGGDVTLAALEQMPLMKSVVYECLRIEPPVPLQYGKAKRDLLIESHDAAFQVKEGEMLVGYQPMATKDPRIFHRAEEFVAGRFVGEEGERMLRHVLWSNGPEDKSPNFGNKQCAGKDLVMLVARLLVVELFLRYDSFDIDVGSSPRGATITLTSLKKATF